MILYGVQHEGALLREFPVMIETSKDYIEKKKNERINNNELHH